VKTAKRLQDIAQGTQSGNSIDNIFDEMLLKAFRIVIRGVRFLDIWNEHMGLNQTMRDLGSGVAYTNNPLTPPADKSGQQSENKSESSSTVTSAPGRKASRTHSRDRTITQLDRNFSNRKSTSFAPSRASGSFQLAARPLSLQNKGVSISHRLSISGHITGVRNANLASERLSSSYDAFLGLLGTFIGLHLQSRSSSELLLTTKQSVQTCGALLSVVEAVWENDQHRSEPLQQANDLMHERIAQLVQAARDVFIPSNSPNDEMLFMPEEGKRLVDAATACVKAAGDCVARTRVVLEQIGDFEPQPLGLGISSFDADDLASSISGDGDLGSVISRHDRESGLPEPSNRPPPPPIQIPEPSPLPSTPSLSEAPSTNDESPVAPSHRSSARSMLPPLVHLATPLMDPEDYDPSGIVTNIETQTKVDSSFPSKAEGRNVTRTGSHSTYVGSLRDSEVSALSQTSTRATSPDTSSKQLSAVPASMSNSFSGSQSTLTEEVEEGEAKVLEKTYAHEILYNKDGQTIGGSLPALIEKLTGPDATPDALFVTTFYLTFRLFASPNVFAEALANRFDYIGETPAVAGPVRLRVYNVYKGWLEAHWRHDCDNVALDFILNFARTKLMIVLPTAGKRLTELAEKVSATHAPLVPRLVSSIGKTNTSIAQYVNPDAPMPAPIISKGQLNALKQWKNGGQSPSILDFDPLELARQFTIKESAIFCSILPEELLATEWMKKSGSLAVNVRAMSTLSTDLANLVADCILQLEEPKKRAVIIKQWVKIANKCLELNNYDSVMAIICSLNSSTISRLKKTWEIVSQKTKDTLENLKSIVDVSRNYAVLRQRLQNHVPPCLPFVGTYLTDLTFVDHGNQATRQLTNDGDEETSLSVINFDKHMKTAKIISELQRFQIPYRLTEVPELQTWMQDQLVRVRSSDEKTFQSYYRRSLLLEPREQGGHRPSIFDAQSAGMGGKEGKDKFEFLLWTHSKDKSVATHG
jgi:hypothetical protein